MDNYEGGSRKFALARIKNDNDTLKLQIAVGLTKETLQGLIEDFSDDPEMIQILGIYQRFN